MIVRTWMTRSLNSTKKEIQLSRSVIKLELLRMYTVGCTDQVSTRKEIYMVTAQNSVKLLDLP